MKKNEEESDFKNRIKILINSPSGRVDRLKFSGSLIPLAVSATRYGLQNHLNGVLIHKSS